MQLRQLPLRRLHVVMRRFQSHLSSVVLAVSRPKRPAFVNFSRSFTVRRLQGRARRGSVRVAGCGGAFLILVQTTMSTLLESRRVLPHTQMYCAQCKTHIEYATPSAPGAQVRCCQCGTVQSTPGTSSTSQQQATKARRGRKIGTQEKPLDMVLQSLSSSLPAMLTAAQGIL